MVKVGRNQPCVCGSGKKFKRCHGAVRKPTDANVNLNAALSHIESARKRLRAIEFQRRRQQGHGKPIISTESNGQRFVAIGNKLAYGKWQTFVDFLTHHLQATFGESFRRDEMSKLEEEQHPVILWVKKIEALQAKHLTNPGGINAMPEFGVARAFFGLAYDLYTLEHHLESSADRKVFERLLRRLRHPQQFHGARYEARIAAFFLRAGFKLAWDDEMDSSSSHGEFTATFPETGRQFWVECKMRQPGISGGKLGKFAGLVSDALRKEANLERMVFVELNTPAIKQSPSEYGWREWAIGRLRTLEGNPTASELPSAFVMVTNFPEHHHLEEYVPDAGSTFEGFKLTDYRMGQGLFLEDAIAMRDRNPEIEALLRSMSEHQEIPATFDGSIPGLDDVESRLIIGQRYELDEGKIGVLIDACLIEQQRKAAGVMRMEDGTCHIVNFELSDAEITAAKRYPETFFGAVKDHNPPSESTLDLYDFFFKAYKNTSKERLLELMAEYVDQDRLSQLTQEELSKLYSRELAISAAQSSGVNEGPTWIKKLRPPPK